MSQNLKDTISEIKANVKQHSASVRDEVVVMQAMMNDRDYEVDIYGRNGVTGTFAPGREFRGMISDVVAGTTKMNAEEAEALVDKYEFKKAHASTMVDMTKEFLYAYTSTGRKFRLGGREDANVSFIRKDYEPGMRRYPTKIGQNDDGTNIMGAGEVWVDGYSGIKASSPCPPWIPKKR